MNAPYIVAVFEDDHDGNRHLTYLEPFATEQDARECHRANTYSADGSPWLCSHAELFTLVEGTHYQPPQEHQP
jgi:hypothetical protein